MKIILFTHPDFLGSQSMPRYANMLCNGMRERGHDVEVWCPKAFLHKLPIKKSLKKWLGYIDQYILFPIVVKLKLTTCSKDSLFVFADQALGPWVPLVKNMSHVVHCHDFLALKSALGIIPENPTGFTGKIYQNYIRKGFSKGKYFISISEKTEEDLQDLHQGEIISSVVCYNGLNRHFEPMEVDLARQIIGEKLQLNLLKGYFMHIGGNQYYKNHKGILEIYEEFRTSTNDNTPLLLIGSKPIEELLSLYKKSNYQEDIHFISDLDDEFINAVYAGSTCLLFPSLYEGFGWPIAEAMASGCLVLTTAEPPMTEVLGSADFFLIPKRPFDENLVSDWAMEASKELVKITQLSEYKKNVFIKVGHDSVKRFDTNLALDKIEKFYYSIKIIQH